MEKMKIVKVNKATQLVYLGLDKELLSCFKTRNGYIYIAEALINNADVDLYKDSNKIESLVTASGKQIEFYPNGHLKSVNYKTKYGMYITETYNENGSINTEHGYGAIDGNYYIVYDSEGNITYEDYK